MIPQTYIFLCLRESEHTPLMYSRKMNSPRSFSCMCWFYAAGYTCHIYYFLCVSPTLKAQLAWFLVHWATPPVRLGLSGRNSGKIPERLRKRSQSVSWNSLESRLPEHFQNSLPPSTAGDASFFRSGSGEGLSEPVMEFPAVLVVFLIHVCFWVAVTK